jgi:hypothetical protein
MFYNANAMVVEKKVKGTGQLKDRLRTQTLCRSYQIVDPTQKTVRQKMKLVAFPTGNFEEFCCHLLIFQTQFLEKSVDKYKLLLLAKIDDREILQ